MAQAGPRPRGCRQGQPEPSPPQTPSPSPSATLSQTRRGGDPRASHVLRAAAAHAAAAAGAERLQRAPAQRRRVRTPAGRAEFLGAAHRRRMRHRARNPSLTDPRQLGYSHPLSRAVGRRARARRYGPRRRRVPLIITPLRRPTPSPTPALTRTLTPTLIATLTPIPTRAPAQAPALALALALTPTLSRPPWARPSPSTAPAAATT